MEHEQQITSIPLENGAVTDLIQVKGKKRGRKPKKRPRNVRDQVPQAAKILSGIFSHDSYLETCETDLSDDREERGDDSDDKLGSNGLQSEMNLDQIGSLVENEEKKENKDRQNEDPSSKEEITESDIIDPNHTLERVVTLPRKEKGEQLSVFDNRRECDSNPPGSVPAQTQKDDCPSPLSLRKNVTENGRTKKRKLNQGKSGTHVVGLRRSTRRASLISSSTTNIIVSGKQPSSEIPAKNTNNLDPVIKVQSCVENSPPRSRLPPSSNNLNLDDIPVIDCFSVYTYLRTFSASLFLSPFSLETFVASLKCKYANPLTDSIHFSLLKVLQVHLEFLSAEGFSEAADCLRGLNWAFLDVITWPVYLVEYLLIGRKRMKSDLRMEWLNLLNGEYYEQSLTTKLDILRFLCDDVIEAKTMRTEIHRRILAAQLDTDIDRMDSDENYVNEKTLTNIQSTFSLNQDISNEDVDRNIDECFLCKMDGSLICCDGCPAAYHSRCVGISGNELPEGDWYCPECVSDKREGWTHSLKPIRGAELLGIDSYGHVYFSSCGYLLVLESCHLEASSYYYNRQDLIFVIEMLKSSVFHLNLVRTICLHWGIPDCTLERKAHVYHGIHAAPMKLDLQPHSASLNPIPCLPSSLPVVRVDNGDHTNQNSKDGIQKELTDVLVFSGTIEDFSIKSVSDPVLASKSVITNFKKIDESAILDPTSYTNYYRFGHLAASVAEEVMPRLTKSFSKDSSMTDEEIISFQLKEIAKKSSNFYWPGLQRPSDAHNENCGWCFCCRTPNDKGCLFLVPNGELTEGSNVVPSYLESNENGKGHLGSVMHYILSIEERLRGLLSGPWENPEYSKHWRTRVLKASNVILVKRLLLILESNLRHITLSGDWVKHVDSSITMGSSFLFLIKSGEDPSHHKSAGRKRARRVQSRSISSYASTSGILWWRGGRLSRQLFCFKTLPRSLATKAGRQAGCKKIPGIHYPEGSEFTRTSKYISWRAASEMLENLAQLAYQIRDLDSHIRWSDLTNKDPFHQDSKKLSRPLKKVMIRKKLAEGTCVKYLLDFGKRKTLPDIVIKHGQALEDAGIERKKYWLDEIYVPLNLLKLYEEKKMFQSMKKTNFGVAYNENELGRKPSRHNGLSHLLSRDKDEICCCDYCNKDLLSREALRCQSCKGFFHKKHIRAFKVSLPSQSAYSCYRCIQKEQVKLETDHCNTTLRKRKRSFMSKKSMSSKIAKITKAKVKRTPKKVKYALLKRRKVKSGKRGKKTPANREADTKSEQVICWNKKGLRSQTFHAFWLNGVLWAKKPNVEGHEHFKESKILLPSRNGDTSVKPLCALCKKEFNSASIYMCCSKCSEWFHGGVFGLTLSNVNYLLDFKCHECRGKNPPLCPCFEISPENEVQTFTPGSVYSDNEIVTDIYPSFGKRITRQSSAPHDVALDQSLKTAKTEKKGKAVLNKNHDLILKHLITNPGNIQNSDESDNFSFNPSLRIEPHVMKEFEPTSGNVIDGDLKRIDSIIPEVICSPKEADEQTVLLKLGTEQD